ncbi:SMI1/KNR4 family protein [Actinomadura sp. 9N215]|uniref:SMI1/KNR4 family protein n=1 Tax=Actinomadura sp. 9N215 TaxID=3375150 RepID=UPI0037B8284A
MLREPPGDIDRVEALLGFPLPRDLRALYELGDGEATIGLFEGHEWLPLKEVGRVHAQLREPVWPGSELGWDKVVYDASPSGMVRRCSGHQGWIPFAHDGSGNYLAVDMSPAAHGRAGQVIRVGRDYDTGPQFVADSVTTLLGRYLRWLQEDRFEIDDFVDPPRLELLPPTRDRPLTRAVVEAPGPPRVSPSCNRSASESTPV